MKKLKTVLIILVILILFPVAVISAGAFAYAHSDEYTEAIFPDNTTINGYDCSNLTVEEAREVLTEGWNSRTITVTDDLNNELASYTDYGCTYDIDDALASIKQDNFLLAAANYFLNTPLSVSITMTVSEYGEDFKEEVASADFFDFEGTTKTTDAYVDLESEDFQIVKEVYGTEPDVNKFFDKLINNIERGSLSMQYTSEDYYVEPEVTSESEELLAYQEFCKEYLTQKITYELGDSTFTISVSQLNELLSDDLDGSADEDAVSDYVYELALTYNNAGQSHSFTSLTGKKVSVSGGTYGWTISQEEEAAQLIEDIESHEDVSREPIYSVSGYGEYSDSIGDTYIDVDVSKQKVVMFKDGDEIFSSDCVTGCKANGTTTNIGTYYILNKVTDTVLKGDNADGSSYESHVDYWLGVTWGGQGFHDASWRSEFGGDIWKTSGSHGCINMPVKKMSSLYKKAEVGMPVVIHY